MYFLLKRIGGEQDLHFARAPQRCSSRSVRRNDV